MLPLVMGVVGAAAFAQTAPGTLDDTEPTFVVPDSALPAHPSVIVYGDQRFHDPSNTTVADPRMRLELVKKIAAEHPDAICMTGDVPYKGTDPADYENFRTETSPWRDEHLRVYPAIGNHELSGGAEAGRQAWWGAFPELKGRTWYSVRFGSRIALFFLDTNSDLTPGSAQLTWLRMQLGVLPASYQFVLISLHHPPVADIQQHIEVDHNPRPNEIALRDFLSGIAPSYHAAIVVAAGHIHNYERNELDGVTYLVSGGGGARPYYVERTPGDKYQDVNFPVFHYLKFTLDGDHLNATMYKAQDPTAPTIVWQEKDSFVVKKK